MKALQEALEQAATEVPKLAILEKLLYKKLEKQGLHAPKAISRKLAVHILSGNTEPFKFSRRKYSRDIDLAFDEADAEEIERAYERFQNEILSKTLPLIAERISKKTLKDLKSRWPGEHEQQLADLRVVLVPGNHDVSFNHVLNASQEIAIPSSGTDRDALVTELFKHRSRLRWSWSSLSFRRITDEAMYGERLRDFATAYNTFYQGKRNFSLKPGLQYDIFDFPHLDFTLLALCSCNQNDPLNRMASVHPDALAGVTTDLRHAKYAGRMVGAVWHHSLSGVPTQNDYMDSEVLLHLADAGVSLGFHGHQHRAQCIEERHQIAGHGRKIVVVSASTLCAGPSQLTPGQPRGYNVVEIDTDQAKCRIHQRRMHNNDFTYPIWAPAHFTETNEPFLDLEIDRPLRPRPPHLDASFKVETGEQLLGEGKWKEVTELLAGISPDSVGRPLLAKALSEYGNSAKTIELLWPPASPAEAVQIGDAILQQGTPEQATQFLALDIVTRGTDASVLEIARRVRERRAK